MIRWELLGHSDAVGKWHLSDGRYYLIACGKKNTIVAVGSQWRSFGAMSLAGAVAALLLAHLVASAEFGNRIGTCFAFLGASWFFFPHRASFVRRGQTSLACGRCTAARTGRWASTWATSASGRTDRRTPSPWRCCASFQSPSSCPSAVHNCSTSIVNRSLDLCLPKCSPFFYCLSGCTVTLISSLHYSHSIWCYWVLPPYPKPGCTVPFFFFFRRFRRRFRRRLQNEVAPAHFRHIYRGRYCVWIGEYGRPQGGNSTLLNEPMLPCSRRTHLVHQVQDEPDVFAWNLVLDVLPSHGYWTTRTCCSLDVSFWIKLSRANREMLCDFRKINGPVSETFLAPSFVVTECDLNVNFNLKLDLYQPLLQP